jgi:hypothetical protein
MLAVCQFLADGGLTITIGDTFDEQVVICASPCNWEAPVGIDEQRLEKASMDRDEALMPQGHSESDVEEADDDDNDD